MKEFNQRDFDDLPTMDSDFIVAFPDPFTVSHYREWLLALNESSGDDLELRLCHAALSVAKISPESDMDDLPMTSVNLIVAAAEDVIGRKIITENPASTVRHVTDSRVVMHTDLWIDDLPDLPQNACATFPETLTASVYREWTRAIDGTENGFFALFNAAISISKTKGVVIDGDNTPLDVASWLVQASLHYLAPRMHQKKLQKRLLNMRRGVVNR